MLYPHLQGRRILLFAGHTNKDMGTTQLAKEGETRYTAEAEINLDIVLSAARDLEQHSNHLCQVFVGHGSWRRRSRLAYLYKPDVVIDVHCNAFTDPDVRGFEVWCADDQPSKHLAEHLVEFLGNGNPIPSRGVHDIFVEANPRRALWEKIPERPCVLIECGFLTNKEDAELLTHMPFQDIIALKIGLGLDAFFCRGENCEGCGIGGGCDAENDE